MKYGDMNLDELEFKLKHQKMLLDILNRHVNDLSKRVAELEKKEQEK